MPEYIRQQPQRVTWEEVARGQAEREILSILRVGVVIDPDGSWVFRRGSGFDSLPYAVCCRES